MYSTQTPRYVENYNLFNQEHHSSASPERILFKITAPTPSSTALSISCSPKQLPTLFSSPLPTPPPNPAFLPRFDGVFGITKLPVRPSTPLTSDSVSKLPTTSRNSMDVRGCSTESARQR